MFDYECITAEGKNDKPRLVAFGKFAGMAGMIDGLQGLGLKLLAEGVHNADDQCICTVYGIILTSATFWFVWYVCQRENRRNDEVFSLVKLRMRNNLE